MEAAVASATEAFKTWREVPVQQRVRVNLKLQQLVRENMDDIAKLITKEQGKTLADARGDVFRGLEVCCYSEAFFFFDSHHLSLLLLFRLSSIHAASLL